ncbi:MAG: hypothetical protein GY898_20445 [Proteobacteria bacterium]|nr:hypothetical protein [Pseudomonadota bacterium]
MYASPLIAAAVMFAYEFCFIFIWPIHKISPEFGYAIYFEVLWLIMDSILLVQCAMYAKESMPRSLLAQRPYLAVPGAVILATIGMYCFVDWTGMKDGVGAAILAVSIIAVQFPLFVWERQDHADSFNGGAGGDGISFAAIVWRAVGDLFTGLAVWQLYRYVDGSERPGGTASIPGCNPDGATGFEAMHAPGLYDPDGATAAFQFAENCAHFALAPISAANPFTWFLILLMLVCDFLVVSYLAYQRMELKKDGPPNLRFRPPPRK